MLLLFTGCIRGTSREKLYSESGLMSLYDRRTFHAPNYLTQFIPVSRPNKYYIVPRTNKYKFSFFPHCVSAWSNLSKLISGSPSLSIFKSRYLKFFNQQQNSIYGVHNPIGLKYVTRLGTALSHDLPKFRKLS